MDKDKEIEVMDDKELTPQDDNKEQKSKETIVKLPEWSIEPPLQIKRDK